MSLRLESSARPSLSVAFTTAALLLHFSVPIVSIANETAAEIAASGIQFKDEKNVSIEREDLFISKDKVEVTYLFKNHSSQDISTIVAFPVPEYDYDLSAQGNQANWRDFHDFTVEVNGKQIPYQTEVRALYKGIDYTALIKKMGISLNDYGESDIKARDIRNFQTIFSSLSESDKKTLIDNKLVVVDSYGVEIPGWSVSLKYYWVQMFPANSSVTIKHSYEPNLGYDYFQEKYYKMACISRETAKWIHEAKSIVYIRYVKYILLTANNWRQPIKNFHLIIEQPRDLIVEGAYPTLWKTSICSDNKLYQVGKTRFEVKIPNYTPKKDLTVYYFMR